MKLILSVFTCLVACLILSGCYHRPEVASIASIAASPEWRIEPRCGYEGCYPLVDFLVANELQVRVEPGRRSQQGNFTILVEYITPENTKYTFKPSTSTLKLLDGRVFTSHDFTCSQKAYEVRTFQSDNYLKQPVMLDGFVHKGWRYDCFRLYFDVDPPQFDDRFTLNIQGLQKDGLHVDIPFVNFSKGMR